MRAVGGYHAAPTQCRVDEVGVLHTAGVQQSAQFLVQRHERLERDQFLVGAFEDVPFETAAPFQRNRRAVAQVGGSPGGVRGRWADVRADHFGRHHQFGVALDVHAVARVVGVGAPDAVGVLQDAGVGARAAGGAAFDFQAGEFPLEIVEQPIAGHGLIVQAVMPVVHRFGHVAVVVPFDVVDAEPVDQRGHLIVHVAVCGGIGQVEHVLRAVRHVFAVGHGFRRGENPIGVLAGAVGIKVHHFRFEP